MVVFGPRPLFKTLLFPGSNNDMLRQFELFLDLFHILYKISDLWLTVGEVRVASLYISDGITLSRLLLLPERFVWSSCSVEVNCVYEWRLASD